MRAYAVECKKMFVAVEPVERSRQPPNTRESSTCHAGATPSLFYTSRYSFIEPITLSEPPSWGPAYVVKLSSRDPLVRPLTPGRP